MSAYKYLKKLFREKPKELISLQKERLIEWRREPAILKIEHPTNLISARSKGYKAKQGIVLARIRIERGGKLRPRFKSGRRSRHMRRRLVVSKSYQGIAEERVSKNFPNLEVLNSYNAGKDGRHYWFEVILIDAHHPAIMNDAHYNFALNQRGRAHRGLTSAGRKSRGLRHKGKGAEKMRPSLGANKRRGN